MMFQINRKIKSKYGEFYVTADQYRALHDVYLRISIDGDKTHPTFDDFLLAVQQEFASAEANKPMPILVPFHGMLLGIELDGYCHS
jgi:hypothetical protein